MSPYNPERRTILRGTLLAAGCVLCAPVLRAAESSSGTAQKPDIAPGGKISKAQANYQNQPKGAQQCGTCTNFDAEFSTCRVVEGKVSPNGWCQLWTKKA